MLILELGNRSCRVGFVFVSNLNGLKNPQPEPNPFIKRVETLDLYPFNFKRVDPLNPFKISMSSSAT